MVEARFLRLEAGVETEAFVPVGVVLLLL